MDDYLEERDFLGVDFHVHTPASFCYKGSRTDDEYLAIIRRYCERGVKVLAITDHNTIKGYRKFKQMKEKFQNKVDFLKDYINEYPDLYKEYEIVKKDLDLFSGVLVLPGVEFEANPGVHILLIFNLNIDLDTIEKFLVDSGYTEDTQGKENPDVVPRLDVLSLLNETSKFDCIVIAAHVDSDKGIYNCLEGKYRASVFSSPFLHAISYNSPITQRKIKELLNNKEYRRENPLAFVQCSDYHGVGEPGLCITYIKLETINFEMIRNALKHPSECVSPTQHPKIVNILKQIISYDNSIVFTNFEGDNSQIKEAACALLNEGYGTIIVGATASTTIEITGVHKDRELCKKEISEVLSSIKPSYSTRVTGYPYGNERFVFVIQLKSEGNSLYYTDNDAVYILENKQIIKASIFQIEKVIRERLFRRMQEYQKVFKPKYDSIIQEIEMLKENTEQFFLINKIEKHSFKLAEIVNVKLVAPYEGDINRKEINSTGSSYGNTYYVENNEPRLKYAYLRCTCPVMNKEIFEKSKAPNLSGRCIVITPGGGAYYIDNENEWQILNLCDDRPILILTLKREYESIFSLNTVIAWLKSSILLWYASIGIGSTDLYNPEVFKSLVIPIIDSLRLNGEVYNKTLEILKIEKGFLMNDFSNLDEEEFSELAMEHNREIDLYAFVIDKLLYNDLNITKAEIAMVNNNLQLKQIYCIPIIDDETNIENEEREDDDNVYN